MTSYLNKNGLVDGKIPANSKCPFVDECEIATAHKCQHKGKEHDVDFSCAVARGFSLVMGMKSC